ILLFYPLQRLVPCPQRPLYLSGFHRLEDLAKLWTRFETERDQIITAHQGRRNDRFVGEFVALAEKKFIVVEHPMAAFAIDPVQFQLVIKGRSSHKTYPLCYPHVRAVF